MVVFNEKKKSKKQTAITKVEPKAVIPLPAAVAPTLTQAIGELAKNFSGKGDIEPARVTEAFEVLKSTGKLIEDIQKVAKARITALVKETGVPVPETKGTVRSEAVGYELRPTRTGFDSKKVEARFRAKNVDVNKYMDPVVTYVINDGKLLAAAADGVLTKDELEACRYDESYSVWKSKGGE